MSPEVAAALDAVQEELGAGPAWVQSVTDDELRTLLWKILTLYGNWNDLAPLVPRLLRNYVEWEWLEDEMLFCKLLYAVRPELDLPTPGFPPRLEEPTMPKAIRQRIFEFVQTVLRERLAHMPYNEQIRRLVTFADNLAFLAAFESPLEPFLQEWKASPNPLARANLCLFLADYALNNKPRDPLLKNIYIPHLTLLPENQKALDAMFAPAFVAAYLEEHAAEALLLGEGWETGVDFAFDWAMQGQPE